MILSKLLENIAPEGINGDSDVDVKGLAYDSRRVKSGWLFFAVPGYQQDGSKFITDSIAKGAVVVVSENALELGSSVTHVHVTDVRKAMAEMAQIFYGEVSSRLKMIGVTGTNGKTTTAYLIREVLRAGGFLPGLIGTVAYEVGERIVPSSRTTPEAPDIHDMLHQMEQAKCDAAVLEVSSHALDLNRVHGISFDVGVFTNLTQDHLDYHQDMETYFEVKSRLFKALSEKNNQVAIINIDDEWGQKLAEESNLDARILTYGFSKQAMVRAEKIKLSEKQTRFTVISPWGSARINLQLLGRFNIHNALAAIATGGVFGIDPALMAKSLMLVNAVPGRLELVSNRKGKKVFVDYAHTDDALENVLTTLREICSGRLIVVYGCGGNRDQGKRMKMGRVAARHADYSIVTSDNPRDEDPEEIVGEIIKAYSSNDNFVVELDRRTAIQQAIAGMKRKDVLLVAGKGHESYQEIKGSIIPFDDRETVRELVG